MTASCATPAKSAPGSREAARHAARRAGEGLVPKHARADAPRVRDAHWVKPRLVAQVSFTEWTSDIDCAIRRSSDCATTRAPPEGRGARNAAGSRARSVESRHADESRSPALSARRHHEGRLAAYYEAVAEPMLRALEDRPLTLEHWNQGIDKPSWFHQNLGKEAADWLTVVDTPTRTTKSGTREAPCRRQRRFAALARRRCRC
jgi:bifunctional non-homologous end joining protein LigD